MGFLKLFIFLGIFSVYLTGCADKVASIDTGASVDQVGVFGSASCSGSNTIDFVATILQPGTSTSPVTTATVVIKQGFNTVGTVQQNVPGQFTVSNLVDGVYTLTVSAPGYVTQTDSIPITIHTDGQPCYNTIEQTPRAYHLSVPCVGANCNISNLVPFDPGTGIPIQ